jgi:hypothetical protein
VANIISCIASNVVPGNKRTPETKPTIYLAMVDGNPKLEGVDLPIGSFCVWDDNGTGKVYFKANNDATGWTTLLASDIPDIHHENLYFLGSGIGATKTMTVIDGSVIAEQIGIDDELYIMWHFTEQLDKTVPAEIEVEWYMNQAEVGKLVSFELDVTIVDGNPLNIVSDTLLLTDEVVPSSAFVKKTSIFPLTISDYSESESATALSFMIKRVASSNEPIAHPRIHHVSVEYTATVVSPFAPI